MHISILGRGPVAEPLARLAERAGHTVRRLNPAQPVHASDLGQLAVLTGTREALEPMLSPLGPTDTRDSVIIDATTPPQCGPRPEGDQRVGGDDAWSQQSLLGPQVVHAFASVPPEAFSALLTAPHSEQTDKLGVPLAGDDAQARSVVADFMRDIGVEPVDLGGLGNAEVIRPGGALWGKALSQVEMLEAVGWLSGDG